jgi:hypothetical protein
MLTPWPHSQSVGMAVHGAKPVCNGPHAMGCVSGTTQVGVAEARTWDGQVGLGKWEVGEVGTVQPGCGRTVSVRAARPLVGKLLPFDLQKRGEERRRLLTGIAHTGASECAGRQAGNMQRTTRATNRGRGHARRTTQAAVSTCSSCSPTAEQRATDNEQRTTCTVRHASANNATLYARPAHSAKLNPPDQKLTVSLTWVVSIVDHEMHGTLAWSGHSECATL